MFWIDAGICDFRLDKICTVPIKNNGVTVIKVIKTG
jgi:hypothetical protein